VLIRGKEPIVPEPRRRYRGEVMMVGSLPFDTVDEGMRAVGSCLGSHIAAIPDGEVGARKMWCMYLATDTYSTHPDLVETRHPSPEVIANEDKPVADENVRPGAAAEYHWTFRLRDPGRDLDFGDLGYAREAAHSYEVFTALRDAGTIAAGTRFQVSLPATSSGTDVYFDDTDTWPTIHEAYRVAMTREISKMLETIPADDLVIQLDLAWEVVDLSIGDEQYFPWWPPETFEQKLDRHLRLLADLADGVSPDVVLGLHWCYGTWGGWPMTDMDSLELCVRLSNEAVRRISRPVDYVHMPVTESPDDAFLRPLRGLNIGDTYVYLGLVHPHDGVEGAQRRIAQAHEYLKDFGIAAVCGFGREDPQELREILEIHKAAIMGQAAAEA
jgi:hypothetical protein